MRLIKLLWVAPTLIVIVAALPEAAAGSCTFSSSGVTVLAQSCSTQSNGFSYGVDLSLPPNLINGSVTFTFPGSVTINHIGVSYRQRPTCDLVLSGFANPSTGVNVQPALILQTEQKGTQEWDISESMSGVTIGLSTTNTACNDWEVEVQGWS
jgi:hypothetical protein